MCPDVREHARKCAEIYAWSQGQDACAAWRALAHSQSGGWWEKLLEAEDGADQLFSAFTAYVRQVLGLGESDVADEMDMLMRGELTRKQAGDLWAWISSASANTF